MNNRQRISQGVSEVPAAKPDMSKAPGNRANTAKANGKDPRGIGYYAVDKTFETVKDGFRHLEEERPGTNRRITAISLTGIGLTTMGVGISLFF